MMYRRLVLGFSSVYFLLFVVSCVKGTLTPSDPVSLDCGSQQTFTCSVTGPGAGWTITGLSGITAMRDSGVETANNNARITTTDTMGITPTSTITITGFTTPENGTVHCIDLNNLTADEGMTTVSVGIPLCPTTITTMTRNANFTAATVAWSQPTTLPVTSTAATYCPTSSPNCGNSVNCTSPCTINGLDPCLNYSVTVTPSNNCGNATGCMMNMVDSLSQGVPDTPYSFSVEASNDCSNVTAKWSTRSTQSSSATSAVISYCQSSSMNCRSVMCSSSPCTISGLKNDQEYDFTVIQQNNCGNSSKATLLQMSPLKNCVTPQMGAAIGAGVAGGLLVVIIIVTIVVIVVVCYCCPRTRSACCCCESGGSKRSTSTEPMKPQPGEEYADPQKVRENKESGKQGGITYAALEFSEQAGSTGGPNVRSKEQPVQYMAVEHA